MVYEPDKHHRRSIRLKDYDYTQAGAYFITVCTKDRACLFGEVVGSDMRLNDAGQMIEKWWLELNHKFPTLKTDACMVMPNHVHGIAITTETVGADLRVGPDMRGAHTGAPLPTVAQWFKTMTTNEYIRGVKQFGWLPFCGHLWQRNYYEHIIRNEESLSRIRQYILDNPARWAFDRENPHVTTPEPEDRWNI